MALDGKIGLLMRCLESSIIRLKNYSINFKPDEFFVHIGGRVSIS